MADRRGIDDVYDVLTGASRDLETEYRLLERSGMGYVPDPRLVRPRVGRDIKSPTYVPPYDRAARNLNQQGIVQRQESSIYSAEVRKVLISAGLSSLVNRNFGDLTCDQLRNVVRSVRATRATKLNRAAADGIRSTAERIILRRCVPKSQQRAY